jgi:hypothetical protein
MFIIGKANGEWYCRGLAFTNLFGDNGDAGLVEKDAEVFDTPVTGFSDTTALVAYRLFVCGLRNDYVQKWINGG